MIFRNPVRVASLVRPMALVLIVLFSPQEGRSQDRITVPDPGPGSFGVLVESLGQIHDGEEPVVFMGPPESALRLRDGGILLSIISSGAPLFLVNTKGDFLRALPQEFPQLTRIARTPNDTIIVWDQGNEQLIILSPDLEEVRRVPLPFAPSNRVVSPAEGLVVAHSTLRSPRFVGLPFHMLSTLGEYIGSFGGTGAYRADQDTGFERPMAPSVQGFLAGYLDRYEVEAWTVTGELQVVLERKTDWFEGPLRLPGPGEVPPSFVSALHEDRFGLIWTAVHVPARDWESTEQTLVTAPNNRGVTLPSPAVNTLWDTRVEVIDPGHLQKWWEWQ